MKTFLLSLFITASAAADTLIIPVQDLLFEVPNFTNAPRFNLGAALNGAIDIESPKKMDRKSRKKLESNLIDMMWDEYPDAISIRIWHGSLIVRMP
jgi:hypothetical protein